MILRKKNKIPIKFNDNISKTLHKKDIKVMSHRGIGNKLLILSLLLNINCSILYSGNNEIDKQRDLYPNKSLNIGNKFSFVSKVNRSELRETLFFYVKIKNPNSEKRAVTVFTDKIEKNLEKKGCQKEIDILTVSVDHDPKGQISKKFIEDEVVKIKQAIVDHKSKKIFKNIVVSIIYDGGMCILAQNIIKQLTNGENTYEICFNADEEPFKVEDGLEGYKNNPNIKSFKTAEQSSEQDNLEVEDSKGGKKKIDDIVEDFIGECFIKS